MGPEVGGGGQILQNLKLFLILACGVPLERSGKARQHLHLSFYDQTRSQAVRVESWY